MIKVRCLKVFCSSHINIDLFQLRIQELMRNNTAESIYVNHKIKLRADFLSEMRIWLRTILNMGSNSVRDIIRDISDPFRCCRTN